MPWEGEVWRSVESIVFYLSKWATCGYLLWAKSDKFSRSHHFFRCKKKRFPQYSACTSIFSQGWLWVLVHHSTSVLFRAGVIIWRKGSTVMISLPFPTPRTLHMRQSLHCRLPPPLFFPLSGPLFFCFFLLYLFFVASLLLFFYFCHFFPICAILARNNESEPDQLIFVPSWRVDERSSSLLSLWPVECCLELHHPFVLLSYPRVSIPFFFHSHNKFYLILFHLLPMSFCGFITVCFYLLLYYFFLLLFLNALTLPRFAICAWGEMCLGFDKTLLGCRWIPHPGMNCFEPV